MATTLEKSVSVAIIVACLSMAGSVVYRTWAGEGRRVSPPAVPVRFDRWDAALEFGHTVSGAPNSEITIVELVDLECPACRQFQESLDSITARYGDAVRLVYVAHPLTQHRFAMAAARGAECAAGVGKLSEWISAVYQGQDSLGLRSWGAFAAAAGIEDTIAIAKCATSDQVPRNVERGVEFGADVGLQGTPTILVNGWLFRQTPTLERLDGVVASLLAGDDLPVPAR